MIEFTEHEGARIKAWVDGVEFEEAAKQQLINAAKLPFIKPHIAVMADCHAGIGSTVGSVIPSVGAIVPSFCGVDIGCGMMWQATNISADRLPSDLSNIRYAIEKAVPHGRTGNGGKGDRGAWGEPPLGVSKTWLRLSPGYVRLLDKHPVIGKRGSTWEHLGTLGTGNHFIELCLDERNLLSIMLHSGSRGVGNRIGSYFIEQAKKDMERNNIQLPDRDLAYLSEGSTVFDDYVAAVSWAQNFALENRVLMMEAVKKVLSDIWTDIVFTEEAVACHHNYISKETHYGYETWVTRKGAVHAGQGVMGIIPGSMGTRSYIVRGKGNPESLASCSHGAGRRMSRTAAKREISLAQHQEALRGVECNNTEHTIDETPAAYKSIDAVMEAQRDLVDVVHTLKAVLCVKG